MIFVGIRDESDDCVSFDLAPIHAQSFRLDQIQMLSPIFCEDEIRLQRGSRRTVEARRRLLPYRIRACIASGDHRTVFSSSLMHRCDLKFLQLRPFLVRIFVPKVYDCCLGLEQSVLSVRRARSVAWFVAGDLEEALVPLRTQSRTETEVARTMEWDVSGRLWSCLR